MRKALIIISAGMLLLVACGQRHTAKNSIEQFLSENLQQPNDMTILHFGRIDSTRIISDSIIYNMRESTSKLQYFNKGINYAERTSSQSLLFIRASYIIGKDTLESTFYMDKTTQKVVAFKSIVKNAENIR